MKVNSRSKDTQFEINWLKENARREQTLQQRAQTAVFNDKSGESSRNSQLRQVLVKG